MKEDEFLEVLWDLIGHGQVRRQDLSQRHMHVKCQCPDSAWQKVGAIPLGDINPWAQASGLRVSILSSPPLGF